MVLVYYKLWYSFSGNFSWKLKANNDSVTIYTALSIGISSTYAYLLQYTNVLIYNIQYNIYSNWFMFEVWEIVVCINCHR